MIKSGIFRQWNAATPTLIGCSVILLMAMSAFWMAIFFGLIATIYLIIHLIFSFREGPEQQASQLIVIIYVGTFILVTAIWFYRDYRENIVRKNAVEFVESHYQDYGYYPDAKTFKEHLKSAKPYGMFFIYYPSIVDKDPKKTVGYSLSYRTALGGIFDDIYYLQKSKTWRYIPDFDEEARDLLSDEQIIKRIENDS